MMAVMGMSEWRIPLSKGLLSRLSVPVTGTEGFPGLVGEIQRRIADGVLALDDPFIDKIGHYAYVYGKGPWQALLRDLLDEIDAFSGRERPGRPDSEVREGTPFPAGPVWADLCSPVARRRKVPLSRQLLQRLSRRIVESDGFPGLVREIQQRVAEGMLTVDEGFVDKVEHHAYVYGKGPWQELLRDVLDEIDSSLSRAP